MSGNRKGGNGKKISRSEKAGLVFSVARVHKFLRKDKYAEKIGIGAAIYLAAILEYLVAEILEIGCNEVKDRSKTRIAPRHLLLAIRKDEEIDELLKGVIIPNGGVIPHIEAVLIPQKTKKKD